MLINLRKLRKDRSLTQKDMADFLGISQNTYSYWETGKISIDFASMQKLAKFFNVPIDYIAQKDKPSDNALSLDKLRQACERAGMNPAMLEKLSIEQLDLIVGIFKEMLNYKS